MRFETTDVTLHYQIRGNGPALIMLHGNCEDMTIFDAAIDVLEKHFTVYLLDSRGHGGSTPSPTGEYHYSDISNDLFRFIQGMSIESPVICGFSDGGIVSLLFAMEHPDLPSRMIVCGANTDPSTIIGFDVERLKGIIGLDPRLEMMLYEPHMESEDLSRITCPTLVVAGSEDAIMHSDTEFIAQSLQNGVVLILEGEDHCSYVEGRTVIADVIMDFCGIDG